MNRLGIAIGLILASTVVGCFGIIGQAISAEHPTAAVILMGIAPVLSGSLASIGALMKSPIPLNDSPIGGGGKEESPGGYKP